MVLCRKGTSGKARVEMYRSEDSVSGQQPQRMVDLETIHSIQAVGEIPPPPLGSVCVSILCVGLCGVCRNFNPSLTREEEGVPG